MKYEFSKKQFARLIILIVVLTVLATTVFFLLAMRLRGISLVASDTAAQAEKIVKKYGKLYEMQEKFNKEGYFKVSEKKEMDAMYKALLKTAGDPYTEYMTKTETEKWNSALNGTFSGIGIVFGRNSSGSYSVIRVIKDSPAEEAGMKAGDHIIKVNGKTYKDMNKMAEAIRGKKGSSVKLEYSRGGAVKTVSIVRGEVAEESVYSEKLKGNIGHIWISSFSQNTYKEFDTELKSMENSGIKGVIIDLRNNGGGYADQGIQVADRLLPQCTITYMEDRNGKKKYYNSKEGATKLKYVLLVNENTASASEIVSAAVKDNHGGSLVGTTTYGKGVVQGQYNYKDGSSMKMTIYQYFSPKGHAINKKGVKPDYPVKLKSGRGDLQLEKAASLLQ